MLSNHYVCVIVFLLTGDLHDLRPSELKMNFSCEHQPRRHTKSDKLVNLVSIVINNF